MKTISLIAGVAALLVGVIITLFFLNAVSLFMRFVVKRYPQPEAEHLSNYYCCTSYGMHLLPAMAE